MTETVAKPDDAEASITKLIGERYSGAVVAAPPASEGLQEVSKFEFNSDFQTKLAVHVLRDLEFMRKVGHLIKPDYFENVGDASMVNIGLRFFQQYGTIPTRAAAQQWVKDDAAAKIIRSDVMSVVIASFRQTYAVGVDLGNSDYFAEEVAKFARHQAMSNAIYKSVDLLGRKKFDSIEKEIRAAVAVGINANGEEYDYWERIEQRTRERQDRAAGLLPPTGITTGNLKMDELLYHKGWGRKELSVIMGGAKSGKCVTRDTIILTEDGMVEIGDYVSESLPVGSFANKTIGILGRTGMETTSHVYNSGENPTLRIETEKGYHVEGTLHHPMLVKSGDELIWKRLDELAVGDAMVVQRGAMVFGSVTDLSYAVAAASARIVRSKRADAMTEVRLPEHMTPDLAEFMSMTIAEGYCGERGALSFTQKDEAILARYVELTQSLFGLTASIQRANGKVVCARLQSVVLQAYLEALDLKWTSSAEKTIPRSIRTAPRECMTTFLNVLLGLEGHVAKTSEGRVTFSLGMASRKLVDQIHVALLNYGIVGKQWMKMGCATNGTGIMRPYYRIDISSAPNIKKLRTEIGLYEPRKQLLLEAITCVDSTGSDAILDSHSLVSRVMTEIQAFGCPLKSTFETTFYRLLRRLRMRKFGERRELTYACANRLVGEIDRLGVTGEASDKLREFVAMNYYFDPIKLIHSGAAHTVDLTVPGTHSFFANGLVSHNTTALINYAKSASLHGHNVLYVTLEVACKIISERLDASISDTLIKELGTKIHDVKNKIQALEARAGKLKLHEFPAGTFTPSMLSQLIERYKSPALMPDGTIREPVIFDVVVVDYADIMAPDHRTDETRENSKQVWLALRAIAHQENVAMLSATQTNREGMKSTVATMDTVADDINKVRTVDILISINITDEERAAGEARLYFAASRNQESGFTVFIRQNLAKMQFISSIIRIE